MGEKEVIKMTELYNGLFHVSSKIEEAPVI